METGEVIRRNRLAYGRIAADWDARQGKDYDYDFHRRCRDMFLACLSGRRILDLGCGLGVDSLAFAADGYRVVAGDIAFGVSGKVTGKESTSVHGIHGSDMSLLYS